MPNYYNPYNFFPATYPQQSYAPQNPQMSMQQMPQQSYSMGSAMKPMEWVDGEVGAKAFQMPAGLAPNTPIPLWDSTDTVIYLKSWSPMGIPNPMQKLKYEMPQSQNQAMLQSGDTAPTGGSYVTQQDLERVKNELMAAMNGNSGRNQNGNNNGTGQNGNRGGDR